MDCLAQIISEKYSNPIEFLNQLRMTTEPIGGGMEYSDNGEYVEYDVAVEAVKKAQLRLMPEDIDIVREQLTAFAIHLNKRGALRDDLCMDFEHEAQSFIESQYNKIMMNKQVIFKRIMANHVIAADALTKADMQSIEFIDAIDHLTDNTIFLLLNCCGEKYLQNAKNIIEKYVNL